MTGRYTLERFAATYTLHVIEIMHTYNLLFCGFVYLNKQAHFNAFILPNYLYNLS